MIDIFQETGDVAALSHEKSFSSSAWRELLTSR